MDGSDASDDVTNPGCMGVGYDRCDGRCENSEIVKCCDAKKLWNCGGATAGGGKGKLEGDEARIGDVLLMLLALLTATDGWRLGTLS